MPKYLVDEDVYNIPDDKVEGFEAAFPNARVEYHADGDVYHIPLDKREGFLKQFPNAAYEVKSQRAFVEEPVYSKEQGDYSQPSQAQREYESRGGFEPIGQGKVKLGETETPVFVGAEGEWRVPSPVMLGREEEIFRHGNPSESEKNEFVRKAKAQLKKETTQGIDSLDETISDKLLAKRREINSNYKAIPVTGVAGGMLGMSQADIVAQSDKEMTTLQAAYNLVQDSKKQVERYNRQDDGFGINTLRSAGEAAIDPSTWDFGLTDMKDSSALLNVVNKEEKGEKLTDAEQLLLDASVNNALIQAYYKAQSMGELAGSGAVNMIPFMAQILLNPLSGVGRKASSAAAKGVAKYINKKIVSKGLLANAVKKVAPRASALAVGLPADMAAGVGMAVTTNAMRTAADANERQLSGEKPGEAWRDAVLNQGIEFASENTGRFFNPLFSGIGKVVGAGAAKVAPKSVVNLAKDISKKGYSRQMKDFFKNTQWDGFLEEYAEEIAGGLMNAAYVGDMSVDKVFSKDNLLETAAGLSVASVLFPTMGTINYGVQKLKQRKRVAAAEAEAERVFGKRWPAFYEAINSAETDDELRTNIAEVYHRENRQDVTKDELQALYDYVAPLFAYRAIRDMSPSSVADMLADDVYSTAYAQDISPKLANESYKAWENAGKKVSELLNLQDQSVEDWLGGRTVEDAANGNQKLLDALTAYETAKADFEGRRDRYQQDKQRAYSESDKAIDKMANNGIVYSTQLGGQTVNITGGDVVLNENGTVDYESSSDAFYVTMPDGTVRVMASENIPGMVLAENAEELKANERAKIDERWRVEFDAAEMAEQTATPSDQVSDQVAQPVTPTANSFTLEENGTVNSVEVLDESGDVARVSINGQEVEMSHEWLAEARAAAGVEVQPISSEAVTEEQPVEVAEQETVQAATPATALERVPKDENDEPIYEQVDSDTAWDAIVEQTEGDVEMAQAVADGMVADKEVALKKLEKAKSKGGVTIAEKIAAEKERKAKIEAAKQELAKWQEIAGVAANRKAEEVAPVEEVQPVNEMQPVEVSVPETEIKAENGNENGNEIAEVSNDERTEMEARIVDWLSEENLSRAEGKTREEIFEEFGNELMPIAYIPTKYISLVSPDLKDQRIYCGKGYFIDHALRNHAGSGKQVSAEDVDVSKYLNIQTVLDNPDHVKETYVDGKRTVVFIKKIGRFFAELTQVEEDGKIVLHKSLFNQKKEPYAKLNDIRSKGTSSEGGVSSISHADNSAPAISLESRGDVKSSIQDVPNGVSSTAKDTPQVSNEQENEQKSGEKVNTGVNEGVPENAETVPTEAENRTEPTKKVEESSKSVLNDGLQLIEAPTEVTEFDTADEFVAGLLGGIKITPESFRKETGLGIDEQRKLVGIIAGEDKGGVSVERASEIIAENYGEELAASGFHGDVQDIRNMLIDILSSGNPKTYIKQSKERRAAEWVEQETARADAWSEERFGFASYADMLMYEETALERIEEKYRGFDEQEYFNILAENYNYDTTRESERVGNGSEVLQGERAVPSPRTENIGERNEGGAVQDDVQSGAENADVQEQEVVGPVNMETLQLNMSEEDFNALLNSGDKVAISDYLAEMDNALRIDENSPFAGQKALREEYKSAAQQYGKENIPAEVMSDLEKRMQPYSDLSRAIYDRKYALEDKLRELESAAEKATAAKEKEIKVENKNTAFGGFLADKTDLGASTAEKALNKKYNFDGKVMTVAEFVEDAVANGDAKLSAIEEPKYKGASRAAWNRMDAKQQEEDAKKVKESGTKTVYTVNDHNLGKTAYDYAKFLLDKKAEDAKTEEVESAKIEDVGEKIGGAKKDKLRETIDRMKADMEQSDETLIDKIAKLPISKIFNFDFQKLREGGMPNEAISFMEIVKKSIPAKPRTSHKVRRWVNNTLALYKLCLEVGTNWDKVNTILTSRDFAGTDLKAQFDAYMSIGGFDSGLNIGNAKLKQLDKTAGYYKDGKFISSEGKWYVRDAGKHGGIYDTKEDAVEALKAFAGDNAGTTESGKKKEVKFAVYQRREDKSIFIAIKGKSDIVIQDGFKSAKEAFDYIGANNAELQSRYRNLLDKTNADFEENRERKGRDYRNGKDITAEEFRNTFGFRGVEFGNWMTQEDRRKAINECYDALMDLAAVCKVSPKALSLNGTLGMAFGSRGGGKFSAHYEPGKVVINLTKTRGAGTLAHEWFHAIDNYFAKMGETEFGYATGGEGMLPKGIQKYGKRYYDRNSGRVITEEEYNELAKEHAVRREMVDAWEHLMESLKNSDYYKRSNAYARLHNSKYWNDPTELGARAFSVWVENELSKQDTSNDYLANNPRYVKAEVTDAQDKYMPYPFDTDADWMDEAFGNLFEVMQEKETEDGNVVLYRQGEGSLSEGVVVMDSDVYSKALGKTRYYGKKQSDYVARVRKKMEQQAHELAAKLNTPVEVRESADGLSGKKSKAKGWYDVKSGKIVVVVSNHSSVADIQATVLHEVVAHKGLRKLFGERFDTFLDNVYNNVDANIRAEIDALAEKYGNTREATEEYLASLAEDTRFEKVDATLWGRIKQWFLNMLAEAGIKLDFELSDNELRYILWRSYQNLANPGRYNIVKRIEDVAVRARLGIGEYAHASEEIVQVAEEDTAEYTSEEQQIIADAKANGSYMKAPNGEPTKLNEKQWAQVRTANFKKWFGDWEKATRIEKLKMSKPVEITGQEIKASEDIKEYKQNALEYGKSLRGEYTNADTGSSVQVNAQSIKEVLHHDYKDVEHLQSVAAIPALIEQGVYIDTVANELKDANSKVREYQYYVCGLKIGGVDYTVKFVIAVDNNGNRYYDHKLTEIEKSKLLDELDRITSPSSQEENALSAIKDKRLLSILQTNSSKIVDENGEPMVVYHRTPKEFTSFDKEKIGSSTDWGAFGKGFYLSPADFGSIYGENLMSLFVNVKNPLVLNDANAFDVKQPFFSKDYSWRREQSENFTEWVKDSGYDGVWYIEGTGRDEIVAFEPNQMKSASDNTGDFSENENDIRFRERDDVASEEGKETIDDIPTRPMTLMERVKASLLEASAKNKENLKLRRDALRNLGQDLANVLKLMRAQRTYDKSTVETLRVIAKMYFKDAQLLDKLTPYEVTRIMSLLKRSVGKGYRFDEASKLLDILFNAHNKALAEVLAQTEKVKAKKVNAAGVEVMGRLDKYGQELVETYRGAKDLDMERIDEMIAESNNELNDAREGVRSAFGLTETDDVDVIVADYDSTDKVKSDAADVYMQERARYEGLRLAKEYRETILTSKGEISELKKELRDIEAKFRRGEVDGKLFHELRDALWMNILEADAEVIDGYHSVIGALAHDVRESSLRAKAFVQAQIDRAQEIQHDANSDMQGRNADVQGTHPDKWNNSAVRAVMSAMPTFQTMLKKFGEQAVDGKGYLYNRFMPQVTMAADNEFRGRVAAREAIEDKLKDIYDDKKMDIGRFMDLSRKDGVSVMYIEGKEMKEFKLTKGQMLYIYMVDKMADGEMKLRKMGITEDAVAEIAKNLDEQMIQFADWMQGEFLTDLRTKYNAVHERMFGAPMAAIENYFPLKIKKEARGEKGDVSQQNSEDKPSTVTGSIIKRTKNTTALDLSADAMSVLLEHIDNMEHWAAFAEFNRDLNTLLNYRRFQNQVKNMTTLRYGSGDVLWRNFKDVAAVAAGEYRPTKSELDKALLNIAKGVTASKINFRFYTAAKQILSAPAFWTGAAPQYFAKCYTNPKGSWNWAIDNLPGFKERWESRAMGNEKLLEDESDWKVWRNKFVAGATRWGMSANAAVDALTVAMGARAVYLDKYNELKKAGYSEQKADEKARQTAAEAYNESQQSSESAYLSPLQKSGTAASAVFTTFKNSNFGYTRKTAQAIANIIRKTKGDKEKTIAFMAKQMARDGLTPAQAKAYATKLYNRSLWKDYADAALFGVGLQLLWELGGAAIYLIGGDDDEKKDAMMQEAAVRATMGTLQGLPLGETVANAVMAVMAGDAEKFRLPELVAVGDIRNVAQAMDTDAVRGATEVVNMLISIGIGVTPQVLTDILVACNELGKSPEEFGTFLLRFMNAPQSQLEALTIDKAMEEFAKNSVEVGKEYVEYRMDKNVPYFQWLYSDEGEQKAIERYAKRFDKLLDERLDFVVEDATAYDLFYDGAQPGTKKVLSEKRQDYLAGDEAAEFVKRDTKAIVEETLYGKREINTAYFEMSTAEDEDMEFLIKKARKNLEGKADATVAQKSLLKSINSNNNAINKLKRAMQTDPTNKVKYMDRIRAIRTELVDLINNSNE